MLALTLATALVLQTSGGDAPPSPTPRSTVLAAPAAPPDGAAPSHATIPEAALTAPPTVTELERDGVNGLQATFLVAAAPDDVVQLLWDVRRFRDVFPDIRSLRVVADRGDELDVLFQVDAVFRKSEYTLRRRLERAARTIRWQSIAGDVKSIRGSWSIAATDVPDVSRVTYTSFVDVGFIVPTSIVRDVAISKVEEMAQRVRAAAPRRL